MIQPWALCNISWTCNPETEMREEKQPKKTQLDLPLQLRSKTKFYPTSTWASGWVLAIPDYQAAHMGLRSRAESWGLRLKKGNVREIVQLLM